MMRLLLFSDLHCDTAATRRIVQQSAEVDVVLGAGDLANARRNLAACADILREIVRPLVMVAGNNESTEELEAAFAGMPAARVLHGSAADIYGVNFYGIGGGVPVTPFGSWSYDFSEAEASRLLAACPDRCVLISHSPPKGCCDVSGSGQSLGSSAVKQAIERCQPPLVVCGHIHASSGRTQWLGSTQVINAGPGGMIVELV